MERHVKRGEDFRWYKARPVGHRDLNELNEVTIFTGDLLERYPTVTRDNIMALMEKGVHFLLIDVRGADEFEKEHILGAANIPVARIEFDARSFLKKEDVIIVYGNDARCTTSAVAADKLNTLAFVNVMRYPGGLKDWKGGGGSVEGFPEVKGRQAA